MNDRWEPSEAAAARLRDLFERQQQAKAVTMELYLATYDVCEVEGASRQKVADAVGVSKSTIQNWVKRGEQLRGQ